MLKKLMKNKVFLTIVFLIVLICLSKCYKKGIEHFSPGTYHQMYSYQDRDYSGCPSNPHEDPFRQPKKTNLPKMLQNKNIPFEGPHTTLHYLQSNQDPAESFFQVGEPLDPYAKHDIINF